MSSWGLKCLIAWLSFPELRDPILTPKRHWYVLTKALCEIKPNAFAEWNIWLIPRSSTLYSASRSQAHQKGCSFNTRQSGKLYLVSSFGFCAILLRRENFKQMNLWDLKILFLLLMRLMKKMKTVKYQTVWAENALWKKCQNISVE